MHRWVEYYWYYEITAHKWCPFLTCVMKSWLLVLAGLQSPSRAQVRILHMYKTPEDIMLWYWKLSQTTYPSDLKGNDLQAPIKTSIAWALRCDCVQFLLGSYYGKHHREAHVHYKLHDSEIRFKINVILIKKVFKTLCKGLQYMQIFFACGL